VTHEGRSVAGAAVEVWTCDSVGQYETVTDADGVYQFNPYSPDSSAFDGDRFIPAGPIAIIVAGGPGGYVTRREHVYDETCPIRHDGTTAQRPCKMQHVDLQPMTFPQVNAELLRFLEDDCGLALELPPRFDRDALRAAFDRARQAAPGRPPLSEVSAQFSCISDCSSSCSGQHQADYIPCMCICVEGSCGASFGPLCTESAAP
jgi:hypothetical protein